MHLIVLVSVPVGVRLAFRPSIEEPIELSGCLGSGWFCFDLGCFC